MMASKGASYIHHVAIRVVDAQASKAWYMAKLGFRVDREFSFAGLDFVWLRADSDTFPVIELIGGGDLEPAPVAAAAGGVRRPGLSHICLHVDDVEDLVAKLRTQDVRITMDVMDGAPGSGVKKAAFFADPEGNVFEILKLA